MLMAECFFMLVKGINRPLLTKGRNYTIFKSVFILIKPEYDCMSVLQLKWRTKYLTPCARRSASQSKLSTSSRPTTCLSEARWTVKTAPGKTIQ